ncbi:MAG: ComF family protein [Candidatus Lindowbacteria bacterium]|nr:ComF family protein [Candidatus Lindowbacteria bacterium]
MTTLQADHSVKSTWRSFAGELLLGFKNLFLPALCRKCGERILTEENLYFCGDCWATIELVRDPKCPRCGRPHPSRHGFEPPESFVCAECAAQKSWVEKTQAAGLHAGVLRDAIHLLKYRRKRLIAAPLSRLVLDTVIVKLDASSYDAVVPVPLHRNRLRRRGYNQSELIARNLCTEMGTAYLPALMRVKDTPSFSMLGAQERRNQIKDAFAPLPEADVKKKKLVLVDDVVTTGATTNECARTLRKSGARTVDVVAVAAAKML